MDVKLDKTRFYAQIDKDEAPVARGSFGKVFRNSLSTDVRVCACACVCVGGWCGRVTHSPLTHSQTEGDLDVAVKVFDQPDAGPIDVTSEIIRSYADMRYELNKLSTLDHPYIVRFIGVLTNPHSFVLEWAPMKSLEHIRANHAQHHTPLCAQSIFLTLLQVSCAQITSSTFDLAMAVNFNPPWAAVACLPAVQQQLFTRSGCGTLFRLSQST